MGFLLKEEKEMKISRGFEVLRKRVLELWADDSYTSPEWEATFSFWKRLAVQM